jgi:hypothetical protein
VTPSRSSLHETLTVLAFVIRLEARTLADGLPVAGVVPIPRGSRSHGLLRRVRRFPPEGTEFADVDAVAPIVPSAVGDVADQAAGFVQRLEDQFDHFEIRDRGVRADVVDLADGSAFQHRQRTRAVINHVRVIADLLTVAVDGQGQTQQRVGREKRHDFLEVLVRPDVVAAARDRDGQAEGRVVREHQQIGGGLAGAVRAAGAQHVRFQAVVVPGDVTVDLVGADLVEAQLVFARDFQQRVRADQVGLAEHERVEDAAVHVRFSGEVHDGVYFPGLDEVTHEFHVADVPDHDLEPRVVQQARQVLEACGVGQLVQHDHAGVLSLEDETHEVAADEAATASDEQGGVLSHVCVGLRRPTGILVHDPWIS